MVVTPMTILCNGFVTLPLSSCPVNHFFLCPVVNHHIRMGLFYSRPEPRPPPCKCNNHKRTLRQKNDVIQTASLLDLVDEHIIADIFKALKFDVTKATALHDLLYNLIQKRQNLTSLFDFLYRICDPDPQPKTLGNQAQQMALRPFIRPFIQGIDKAVPFTVRYPKVGDVTMPVSVMVHRISGWMIRKKTCNVKIDNQPVQRAAGGCGINTAELLVLLENAETLIRYIERLLEQIPKGLKKSLNVPDTIPFGNGCKIAKLIERYVQQWGLTSSAYECRLHGGGAERFRFEVDVATRVLNGVRLVRNRQGDYMAVDDTRRSVLARDASPEPVLKFILRAARQKALDTINLELARLH